MWYERRCGVVPAHLRAALVHAAARRTDDVAARSALLARARALDPLRAVLPSAD